MTVLVSVVRHAMRRRARRCARSPARRPATRRAALAAYGAAAGLAASWCCCRAARSAPRSSCSRSRTARCVLALDTDFDGCMAIVQRARRRGRRLPRQLDEPAAHRGAEDGRASRSSQQLDWQVPDWVVIPSGNLGNASALCAGFSMMKELGAHQRAPAPLRRAGREREPAVPAPASDGSATSSRSGAKPTQASAIRIGNPVSAPRAMRALEAMNGVVEQASEDELADAARAPIAPASTRARTPRVALARAARSSSTRGTIKKQRERRRRLDRERRSSSPSSSSPPPPTHCRACVTALRKPRTRSRTITRRCVVPP